MGKLGLQSAASMAGRKRTSEPDLNTYSGRVAARIRELREARGWSLDDLAERLKQNGTTIPVSSLYAYEVGRRGDGTGRDIPVDLYPAIAAVFGKSIRSFLPAE